MTELSRTARMPRICSLLPSATEIVYALGLGDQLVAVTHECDYPPEARAKPHVTRSAINSNELTAAQIDQAVRDSLENLETIYFLDRETLEQTIPDLVLSQELCEVCAVGTREVARIVSSLPHQPQVVSLEPRTIGEMLDTILQVGRLTGTLRRAIYVVDELRRRLDDVQAAIAGRTPVSTLTLEWLDPVFVGGHWVPEMVALAGGVDVLGRAAEPSRQVDWSEVSSTEPEKVIVMPCGFGLERSRQELSDIVLPGEWWSLPAVRNGEVYVVDGSSYFNRPGPRLVDGVETLAAIFHPEAGVKAPEGAFARAALAGTR
ncbi:MAG TPA: cobalamin-binding protein [Chloroflexota bacterium]